MEVSEYKCDICGRKAEGERYSGPKGWFTVSCNTEDKDTFWHETKDICIECAERPMSVLNPQCKDPG
ncbi:hypothetical protein LCGC14_1946950 [marine sediment metagenome]|uniref:Uncharacterized protein n=1 Tax=marine sediment metagenome TaxID=412755 RepID=A0A0F9FIH9_9ZZZZ